MVGLKSILEVRTQAWLEEHDVPFSYENETWEYQYEPQKYRPDFNVPGMAIECKGKLTKDVRKKLLCIKSCNPSKKLSLVFERPDNKISAGSKTTYGQWADQHGFRWSTVIPNKEWFHVKRKRKKDS